MSQKRSRSGKKKKSVYLEQKKAKKEGTFVTEEDLKRLRTGRRMHIFSLVLLVCAMVGILLAPSFGEGTNTYIGTMLAAYGATFVAGLLMMFNVVGVDVKRARTNRIIASLMLVLGMFGVAQITMNYLIS